MTKEQIAQITFLMDTVNHYNSKNRGYDVETKGCSYIKGCAIGRHLTKELREKLDLHHNETDTSVFNIHIFNKLPKQLKELGRKFLGNIQALHDCSDSWDDEGISETGLRHVAVLMENIHSGKYA